MFNAKLIDTTGGFKGADYGLSKGKTYEVVDFNEYMGTYAIRNDWGNRMCLNWMRFEDQGARFDRVHEGGAVKTTIRGVRYDSDRAVLVGKHVHGKVEADPSWWSASLYRQPTSGRYFLAGTGGSMTVFRGEARILPLRTNEGLEWADRYLDGEY